MSGWKAIAARFPMTDIHDVGDAYKRQSGVVGSISSGGRGFFNIRLAHEGVCLYPSFARRIPCVIPWSGIRKVSVSDSSIFLVVDYERPLEFFLPAEALPAVKAKLSPELFHQAVSPFETAKSAIEDGAQPRWMSSITGRAVQFAEKQVEKEKQSRKENRDDVV